MFLILLGPPGVGKGTQAKLLAKKYSIPHISAGEILREYSKQNTALGRKIKSIIDIGNLVPDKLITKVISDRVSRDDCDLGVILDGYPRTLQQAQDLKTFCRVSMIIKIELDEITLIERLLNRKTCNLCKQASNSKSNICNCGNVLIKRVDDNRSSILERLKIYRKNI